MDAPPLRIEPLGDSACQVVLGAVPDEATRRRVTAAAELLVGARLAGLVECVPGFTTVTVHYDPGRLGGEDALPRLATSIEAALRGLDAAAHAAPERTVEIPVRYGGEHGTDLEEVARRSGLSAREVIEVHSAVVYRVHLLGFTPGFPYLSGLDGRLHTARRESPRTSVPAGSVAIGGAQTGIYPIESPGGWHVIGRTPLRLFDPHRAPPALLRPGDLVRFCPVDPAEYRRLESGG